MKKALSLFLTVIMILSMFSCLSVVTFAADSDLVLGEVYEEIVTANAEIKKTFIPDESGIYAFKFTCRFSYPLQNNRSATARVVCEKGEYNINFYGTTAIELKAGEEVSCYFYSNSNTYITIEITQTHITRANFVPVEPIEIVQNTKGQWITEEYKDPETGVLSEKTYYKYDSFNEIYTPGNQLIIEEADGTETVFGYDDTEGYYCGYGEMIYIDWYSTQSVYNDWDLGSDNYLILHFSNGFSSPYNILAVAVPVTIVENPCEAVEFVPANTFEIIENTNGIWDGSRFNYDEDSLFYSEGNKFIVNYKDGTNDTFVCGDGEYLNSSGEVLDCSYTSDQSDENIWDTSSDGTITVVAFGKEIPITVDIKETPCESVEFIPTKTFELVEHLGGYWEEYIDIYEDFSDMYYIYDPEDLFYADNNKVVVNYKDGSTDTFICEDGDYVNASGEALDCYYRYEHSYEKRWLKGAKNNLSVYVLGKETKVKVDIIETPYESIEFTPVKPFVVIENTNGYMGGGEYWDDENDTGVWIEYYMYYIDYLFYTDGNIITVNYNDGTQKVYTCENFEYINGDGDILDANFYDSQEYEKWTKDTVNCFKVEALGLETQVQVRIIESPYESIEFVPAGSLEFMENTNGYWTWTSSWDEELEKDVYEYYYEYNLINIDGNKIIVNYKDGTSEVYVCDDQEYVNSSGDVLSFEYESNEWTVGSDNYFIIKALGKETQCYVTITKNDKVIQDENFIAEKISDDECAIIYIKSQDSFDGTLNVPETIEGYSVCGFLDGVWDWYDFTKINLPSTFNMFTEELFAHFNELTEINVSEDNAVFASVNGVLYNKTFTEIIYCPKAFNGKFVIKAGVTELPLNFFADYRYLSSIEIEEGNTSFVIEDGILYDIGFTRIYKAISPVADCIMKPTVTEIAKLAFRNCATLESIVISPNVTVIPYRCFLYCSSLKSIDIPENLYKIEHGAFWDTPWFDERPDGVMYLEHIACGYKGEAPSDNILTLKEGTTSIADGAFYMDCWETVNLPYSLKYIGNYAFDSCYDLSSVIIPECVEYIGDFAFGCICDTGGRLHLKIEDFTIFGIRDSLANKYADDMDFAFVEVESTHEHTPGDWIYDKMPTCTEKGERHNECTICGIELKRQWRDPSGHKYSTEWTIDLEATCTEDGSKSHHCSVCEDKVDVTVIEAIGHNYELLSEAADHPHKITNKCSYCGDEEIETKVVSDCLECNFTFTSSGSNGYKLISYIGTQTKVKIPVTYNGRTVTTVANSCFKGNTIIEAVDIPDGVTSIGALAFMNCTSLKKVIIPTSVTSIGMQAFYGFTGVIYCVSGSASHEYAVANNLNYMLISIAETENTTIDYDNFIIRTSVQNCSDIYEILGVYETAMAIPTASYMYDAIELYGTGTVVTVFDGNDFVGDFTLIVNGDTNGDSVCDVLDCAQVESVANGSADIYGAYAMAADSNSDDMIEVNDYQDIVNRALAS